jgi:hypothetical protein
MNKIGKTGGPNTERAARERLVKRAPREQEDADRARKRAALMACAGFYKGDATSATNERVREVVGDYLEAKYGRRHARETELRVRTRAPFDRWAIR